MKLECKNANNEITRYLKLGEKENYLDYVLSVDGGGTKTVAQIADLSGKMVAESESRPSNYKSVGIEVAKEIEFLLLEFLKKNISRGDGILKQKILDVFQYKIIW